MNGVAATFALEARVVWRYGVVAVSAVLAALWTGMLLAVPAPGAQVLAPYLLFLDTAGFGALFAVGLLMFERVEGTAAARAITPVSHRKAMLVRVGVLTLPAIAMAVPMTAVTVPAGRIWGALAYTTGGVALTSILLVALCLGLGARTRTFQGAMLATAPAILPFTVLPVLHLAGVAQTPLLWVVPTTATAELINRGVTGQAGTPQGPGEPIALLYAVAFALAVCWWAVGHDTVTDVEASSLDKEEADPVRAGREPGRDTTRSSARVRPRRPAGSRRRGHPVTRLARHELGGVHRDPLLLAVGLGPLPLALVLRWAHPVVDEYLRTAHGVDLAAHIPAVFATLVLLHVPMIVGAVVALRVAEDTDDNILLILRVSPLSLTGYFGFRAGTAALLALLGLAVAVPVSGLAPSMSPGLAAAIVLATLFAPLAVLATTAYASNKVEALVVIKTVAAVSVLTPVLVWILPTPWWSPLLALPPTWPLLFLSGYPGEDVPPAVVLLGGVAVAGGLALTLIRRIRSRLLT
ncbi:hypothetical protein J4H86_00025 [Spiractinospora alimapuensis]|uniref:fluoroquinolone export ABC transporter permease subunit n=1 Tax=Spiractinospora alimapuensis TaxID=2820884 RepID=UPI001F46676A|nr:hypothetical protein [Spiractinospora alimapuensis]QVQ52286.1 hypothetical protein J4H86_26965 [Spiractinospora alimapuensis]QVQ52304.1 hypothetical protein J4H86_00025 [Spiractinospora alimapuensis]